MKLNASIKKILDDIVYILFIGFSIYYMYFNITNGDFGPDDGMMQTYGVRLGEEGKYQEALEAFDEAIKRGDNSRSVWYNKGKFL